MRDKKISFSWEKFKIEFSRFQLIVFILLILFYFLSRLVNLTEFPIFCDEAIYIRWAQVMKSEPSLRFLPLSDGKQPLFMWLMIPLFKVFPDPLLAGRMVSVLSGFSTFLGLGVLSFILFKVTNLSLMTMFLYFLSPFNLFFDRLALVDSLLACFSVWVLIFTIWLGKEKRLDLAMILGMVLGGALLTKSPGMVLLLISPLVIFTFSFRQRKKSQWVLLPLLGVSFFLAMLAYNILRLGPGFQMIALRNQDYVYPLKEILKHPFDPLGWNLRSIFRYYWSYLTPAFLILASVGLVRIIKNFKKTPEFLILIFWWLAPLIGQGAIAKVFTARYILFSTVPLILFAGFGWQAINRIKKRVLSSLFLVILLIPVLNFNLKLLFNPSITPLPTDEKRGYLEDWTAGWGIRETALYLNKIDQSPGIVVATEGFFGTLPDGLQIYFDKSQKVTVLGAGQPVSAIPESLIGAKKAGNRAYLLVNRSRASLADYQSLGLEMIKIYPKPPVLEPKDYLLFLEVKEVKE